MASGAPDYTLITKNVIIVENESVVTTPAVEAAAGGQGRYTGTDQTYQTVKSWTVTADKQGELKEILILSSLYTKTHIKIVIGSATWCEDWIMQAAMPLIFEDLALVAATVVTVSAKSTDGTSITVDAIITAKEIG